MIHYYWVNISAENMGVIGVDVDSQSVRGCRTNGKTQSLAVSSSNTIRDRIRSISSVAITVSSNWRNRSTRLVKNDCFSNWFFSGSSERNEWINTKSWLKYECSSMIDKLGRMPASAFLNCSTQYFLKSATFGMVELFLRLLKISSQRTPKANVSIPDVESRFVSSLSSEFMYRYGWDRSNNVWLASFFDHNCSKPPNRHDPLEFT